ncbi:hypothetical protein ACS0TY_033766 [Phlomoides rotata]
MRLNLVVFYACYFRLQQITPRLRAFAQEAVTVANCIDAHLEELREIISQVAVNIHGTYVPISSPDNKNLILLGPNLKLKKATIVKAAKQTLEREVYKDEYQKASQELCIFEGSTWVPRGADVYTDDYTNYGYYRLSDCFTLG